MWCDREWGRRVGFCFSIALAVGACGKVEPGDEPLSMGGSSGAADGGAPSGGEADGGAPSGGEAGQESCRLAHHLAVPFPIQRGMFVVKSGVEFAVTDGATLSAASWSGELAERRAIRAGCANCDGLFGLTALRAQTGWRLLSLDRDVQGASARAWPMNDPGVPEAVRLFGAEYSGLVSAFAFRPSRDGTRAVFANGHRVVTSQLTFTVLDENAQMLAPVSTLELPFANWDYLSVVPTEHAAAISVTAESDDQQERVWILREPSSSGQLAFASQVSLPSTDHCLPDIDGGGCVVVEDADGYYIQLVSVQLNVARRQRIGQVRRDRPNELVIDDREPPGILVGTFPDTLVFRHDESTETAYQTRFIGLPKSGAAEPQTLFVTAAVDRMQNSSAKLIATEGNSLFYGFQTQDAQVIEEVACAGAL